MTGRKVKISITETFEKQVEVTVPCTLNSDALIERWVYEECVDVRILDATSSVGVKNIGSDMDYCKKIEVKRGDNAAE